MSAPISVTILVPSDYSGDVSPEQAVNVVYRWADHERIWFLEQINKVVIYNFDLRYSLKPKSYFSTKSDDCGNIVGTEAWSRITEEVGWSDPSRNWIICMGAGGWSAGLKLGTHQHDIGWGVIGDFGIYRELGIPSPCDLNWYTPRTGFIVESLHSMGVDSENPFLQDFSYQMSREQKKTLTRLNRAFLYTP